jgi:septal ring factor EnvC (AmiA/AmiB activator)
MIRPRFALLIGGIAASLSAASAQTPAPTAPTSAQAVQKSEREKELKLLQRDLQTSREREAKIKAEIDAIKNDRALLNKALVDSAAKVSATEARLTATEAKLKPLDQREAEIKKSLTDRRAVLGEVLAAMQRISASPPPALILEPKRALESVRAAILLGALVPELRGQAEKLIADLSELSKLRNEIEAERDRIANDQMALANERSRISALIEERQRQFAETQKTFEAERARSNALAKQAESLQDLVNGLEKQIAEAATREAKAEPKVPFADMKGKLMLPVAGKVLRAFGADNGTGGT